MKILAFLRVGINRRFEFDEVVIWYEMSIFW